MERGEIMFEKRLNLFAGHFGSGKTEVAVNYAIQMSQVYPKTAIADIDIVNPYFRTADAKKELENRGIWVILPMYANTNVDIPVLPAEMNAVFEKKEYKAVFDVGGDDIGALALSRYREEIASEDYEMFFVVNTRRPFTDTEEKIDEMAREIEYSSRLKITGFVNNTNLLQFTTLNDIIEGQRKIKAVADKYNVPIAITSGFFDDFKLEGTILEGELLNLNKYIKLPF
ncbi:MAG: hypothetical protein Q8920_12035 [Bacillota bacterium]|nr:hypothetical protein [Bacillota bacterium]